MRNLFGKIKVSPKGFTLIELLVVIVVLGVLAAGILVAINPLEQIAKAKDATKKSTVAQLTNALQAYYTLKGQYPVANNGWITALVNNGDLKNVPSSVPYSCTIQQNGYCYKLSSDGTEAVVYTSLETSERPSGTSGTTPYFLWSSVSGESGIYYSVSADVAGTSGFTFGPSSTLTQGLIGWWKMDGDVTDASGNGNNGTVVGATLTTGKSGQAYSFNGTSDYISLSAPTIPFTFAGWFWWGRSSGDSGIIQGPFTSFYQHPANNYLYISNGSSYFAAIPTVGQWNHIVITASGNQSTVKVFLNGAKNDNSNPNNNGFGTPGEVGRNTFNQSSYFQGSIDDVRIYNRVLSNAEITALYQSY